MAGGSPLIGRADEAPGAREDCPVPVRARPDQLAVGVRTDGVPADLDLFAPRGVDVAQLAMSPFPQPGGEADASNHSGRCSDGDVSQPVANVGIGCERSPTSNGPTQ